jgi:hypothetical protein
MNGAMSPWWFNRGIAESRLHRFEDAFASYSNAARLKPADDEYRDARDRVQDYLAGVQDYLAGRTSTTRGRDNECGDRAHDSAVSRFISLSPEYRGRGNRSAA